MPVCQGYASVCRSMYTERARRRPPSTPVTPLCTMSTHPQYHTAAYFLYHIRVILVCRIFFCNWKIPNISASDVGGQPGT